MREFFDVSCNADAAEWSTRIEGIFSKVSMENARWMLNIWGTCKNIERDGGAGCDFEIKQNDDGFIF